MDNVLLFTTKNKAFNKVITVFITLALCLVLAFAPLAFPCAVAYANEVYSVGEAMGAFLAAVASYWASSALITSAGITTGIMITATAKAFICLLIAMGVGITVATLIRILTSEQSLSSFGVEFWRTLKGCYDLATSRLVLTGYAFMKLSTKIKQVFGIEQETKKFFDFPYNELDSIKSWSKECSVLGEAPYGWTCTNTKTCPYGDIGFTVKNKKNRYSNISVTYSNSCVYNIELKSALGKSTVISGTGIGDGPGYCLFTPVVAGNYLYIPSGASYTHSVDHTKYFGNIATQTNIKNASVNGNKLVYESGGLCSTTIDGNKKYLAVVLPDMTIVYKLLNINMILYYLIIKNASLVYSSYSFASVPSIDKLHDDVVSLGNLSGSIPTGSDVINYREYSKDATYDKSKDLVRGITDSVDEADAESLTGDVLIGLTDTSNPALVDADGNVAAGTYVSDIANVTEVTTDASIGDTSVSVDPYVSWLTGINLVKNASAGITDKFPFCIPSYLKNQLNLLVSDDKEPIFKIPFKVESANLSSEIVIDLTKFEKVTRITDFFLVLILAVGLSFATKKMFF